MASINEIFSKYRVKVELKHYNGVYHTHDIAYFGEDKMVRVEELETFLPVEEIVKIYFTGKEERLYA